MDFNPDEYLAKQDNNDFNPDEYLKEKVDTGNIGIHQTLQGLTGGFTDEISGGVEATGRALGVEGLGQTFGDIKLSDDGPTLDWEILRDAYKGARDKKRKLYKKQMEESPGESTAYNIAGGVFSPINKVMGGASAVKSGLALGGLNALGYSDADNAIDMAGDVLKGGAIGGSLGYAAQKALPYLSNLTGGAREKFASFLRNNPKANADDIQKAAQTLGVEATPGMFTESPLIQRLESSLSESPSWMGQNVKGKLNDVYEKSQKGIADITKGATPQSPFQLGEDIKASMGAKVAEELGPSSMLFNEVAETTKNVPVSKKGIAAIQNNIRNLDEVRLFGERGQIKDYIEMLENVKNVDDLKQIGTNLNLDIKDSKGAERRVLNAIKEKIRDAEESNVMRAAEEMKKATGSKLALDEGKDIVSRLKEARAEYAKKMSDFRDVAETGNLGKFEGAGGYLDAINDVQSEKLPQQLFNLKNEQGLRNFEKAFPEAYQTARSGALGDFQSKVSTGDKYSLDKFATNLEKLNPESQSRLFGNELGKAQSVKEIANAFPKNYNPSFTASQSMFNKEALSSNITDIPRYAYYKLLTSDSAKKISEGLINKSNQMKEFAMKNPQGFANLVNRLEKNTGILSNDDKNNSKAIAETGPLKNKDDIIQKTSNSKYAQVMQKAAEKGGHSLAAANYVLQQRDPEYRKVIEGE